MKFDLILVQEEGEKTVKKQVSSWSSIWPLGSLGWRQKQLPSPSRPGKRIHTLGRSSTLPAATATASTYTTCHRRHCLLPISQQQAIQPRTRHGFPHPTDGSCKIQSPSLSLALILLNRCVASYIPTEAGWAEKDDRRWCPWGCEGAYIS